MTSLVDLLTGDGDPASLDGYADHPPRMGFFTDTSVCIGCKPARSPARSGTTSRRMA